MALLFAATSLLLGLASATREEPESLRRPHYKKWRGNPKMVVFGDSGSDVGRRFNAPASVDIEGIGPFPWEKLFESPDSDSKFRAYLPAPGSPTNGKVWPSWLRVPDELNFATSSASASDAFRSRETCTGYSGEGEDFPTATLEEQVTRYFHDIVDYTDETLDYTHIIAIGGNEPIRVLQAIARYTIGGIGYVDPVEFHNVLEFVDGAPTPTFEPALAEIVRAWREEITRLIERGVTGRILLGNLGSPRGLPGLDTEIGNTLDLVSLAARTAAETISQDIPQVRVLDLYALGAAIVDDPEVFESLGFTGGSSLTEACLTFDFFVDDQTDIMGPQFQAARAAGCQEDCALCADGVSPCQNCFEGNPSGAICENPERYVFWDSRHFTTDFHQILAEAIRQCTKDEPNYNRDWVELLCPVGA